MCAECERWQQMAEVDGQRLIALEATVATLTDSLVALQRQLTAVERAQEEDRTLLQDGLGRVQERVGYAVFHAV